MNYQRLVWRFRSDPRLFTAEGDPGTKFDRVFRKALAKHCAKLRAERRNEPRGPYSGLTRRELRQSGTCETDWF